MENLHSWSVPAAGSASNSGRQLQCISTNSYAFLSKHPIYFEGRLLIGSSTPHFLFFAIFFPPSISLVNTENQAVFHARQSYFVRYTYFDIKRWESSMFRIDCLC